MQMLITLEHRQHKISFSRTRMAELGSQGCQGFFSTSDLVLYTPQGWHTKHCF